MQAKILVDVVGDNVPAIRINQGSSIDKRNWSDMTLADKMLTNLFRQDNPGELILLRVGCDIAPESVKVLTRVCVFGMLEDIGNYYGTLCLTEKDEKKFKESIENLKTIINGIISKGKLSNPIENTSFSNVEQKSYCGPASS